jgi:hypothetical protein
MSTLGGSRGCSGFCPPQSAYPASPDRIFDAMQRAFCRAIKEALSHAFTDKRQPMATLEAFRTVLDDARTPEIIRNHIIDSLQYALRNHGQIFTSKEVEWLARWDDARIPLAASRELQKRTAQSPE